MKVTDADREKATELLPASMVASHPQTYGACVRNIAAALAEERRRGFNEGALAGMKLDKEHRASV